MDSDSTPGCGVWAFVSEWWLVMAGGCMGASLNFVPHHTIVTYDTVSQEIKIVYVRGA